MILHTQQPTTETSPAILTEELRQPVRKIQDLVRAGGLLSTSGPPGGSGRIRCGGCRRRKEHVDDPAGGSGHRRCRQPRGSGSSCDCRRHGNTSGSRETDRCEPKQARPLDADALAAIRATALNPRRSRGGSLDTEETALSRGRLDIALRRSFPTRACVSLRPQISGGATFSTPRIVSDWFT